MSIFFSSFYISDISTQSDVVLVKIFVQSLVCLFVLLTVTFSLKKLCNVLRSHLSILDLIVQAIDVLFRNISPVPIHMFQALHHFLLYKFQFRCFSFFPFFKNIFIRYFSHLHFQCYTKIPHTLPPSTPLLTHSHFLALAFPCTRAYKVCMSNGPLFQVMAY